MAQSSASLCQWDGCAHCHKWAVRHVVAVQWTLHQQKGLEQVGMVQKALSYNLSMT